MYQSIPKLPVPPAPPLPPHPGFPPYSGEFGPQCPQWGSPSQAFDFCVKTLIGDSGADSGGKGKSERAKKQMARRKVVLLSPIFLCHKIKDGGYNNTNINKLSPDQNTPALQALINHIYFIKRITKRCFCYLPSSLKQSIFSAILHLITITAKASKSVSLRWEINSVFMILFSVQQQNNFALA